MYLCGGFMKSILNERISEVNAEKRNNLICQFQLVGHEGSPLSLSICIHKHKWNFYLCIFSVRKSSLLSVGCLIFGHCRAAHCCWEPWELWWYQVKGWGFTEGMEDEEPWPTLPSRVADGINAYVLAISLFLKGKGKNKKTRHLYAIKIYLNWPQFLHL